MLSAANYIRNRPVTSFVVLTFAISYGVGIPFNFVASSLFRLSDFWAIYLPRLVTVLGPAVAAIVVARAGGGSISVADLARSLSIPVRYLPWLVVIVFVGVATALAAFGLAGMPASQLFEIVRTSVPALGAHFLVQAAMIGVGEELGWRGWLLPSLAGGRTFASATALTGLAWTAWHMPVFFSGLASALGFLTLLAALSVVFAWLWIRGCRSAGIVALAHASVNAPFFWLESNVRARTVDAVITTKAFAYFSALYLCIAIVLLIQFRHIWSTMSAVSAAGRGPVLLRE